MLFRTRISETGKKFTPYLTGENIMIEYGDFDRKYRKYLTSAFLGAYVFPHKSVMSDDCGLEIMPCI